MEEKEKKSKRLYRSTKDKVIAGVCGGIGEYFGVDSIWIRLAAVLLFLIDGVGLILYVAAWILIPANPVVKIDEDYVDEKKSSRKSKVEKKVLAVGNRNFLFGMVFIMLGVLFLLKNIFSWFTLKYIWPIAIILLGIYIMFKKAK